MTLPLRDSTPLLRFAALSTGLVVGASIVYYLVTLTLIGLGMFGFGTDCSQGCTAP